METNTKITIYTDGGSRGNPGQAAYGFVIYDSQKKVIYEEGKSIGINTNNVAEYSGIMEALRYVKKNILNTSLIEVFMDSQLATMQLLGKWKIKNENLRSLFFTIKTLEKEIGAKITYTHVRREFNKEADKLVNQALDSLS